MEIKVYHIEPDGTAMVKFDLSTAKKLKDGQTLVFQQNDEPFFMQKQKAELDTSRIANCSTRVKAIILIYFYYVNLCDLKSPAPFQNSVKKVAEELEISLSSVYDKFTRQIKCTASEFQNLLAEAYNGDITNLQSKLLNYAVVNNTDSDIIKNYLPKINKIL